MIWVKTESSQAVVQRYDVEVRSLVVVLSRGLDPRLLQEVGDLVIRRRSKLMTKNINDFIIETSLQSGLTYDFPCTRKTH